MVARNDSSPRFLFLLLPLALGAPAGCQSSLPVRPTAAVERITLFEQFLLDEPGDTWAFRTPQLWRIAHEGDRRFLQMAIPPDRSIPSGAPRPQEYAIYTPYQFHGFSLSMRLRVDRDPSIVSRDAVILFGWQDDAHFYYAHLSGLTDEWHNTLVRVDGRTHTSLVPLDRRPPPLLTDRAWHKVDVLRDANAGTIEVYVDAYEEAARPAFRVVDRTYQWGHIGMGSLDDHVSFASVKIEGEARPAICPQVATRPVP